MDFRIGCFESRKQKHNNKIIIMADLYSNFAFMMCESIIYSVLITVDFLIKNAVPIVKAFVSSVLLFILSGSALR